MDESLWARLDQDVPEAHFLKEHTYAKYTSVESRFFHDHAFEGKCPSNKPKRPSARHSNIQWRLYCIQIINSYCIDESLILLQP